MSPDLVNLIFGMKLRQARTDVGLSLSEFAARCDLSPSYITEIEKGRKYPKADKIMKIADVLGKDYDDLVSIKLAPKLTSLETILSSPLLQHFPFEEFGLELSNLVNLFTRAPVPASALLHAVLEVGRQYNLKDEHFLRAALRSYQEMHDNYFQDLEDAATAFAKQHGLTAPVSPEMLRCLIQAQFDYQLDDTHLANHELLSGYRSVYVNGSSPKLLINAALQPCQINFLLLREIGYQVLKLKERADTSAPNRVDSFQQVLNDFKASYFAGAVMIPRGQILGDLQEFFHMAAWSPYRLLTMLETYDITPEMLLYRVSQLVPQFFGPKLHFLRFHQDNSSYTLVKQLNISRFLPEPSISPNEHYCHRWLPIRLLKERTDSERPYVGAQISEFLDTRERFLSFGFARPLSLSPGVGSSIIVGFQVTPDLKRIIRFVDDPKLPIVVVNETCERCPLTEDQCAVRVAPPTLYHAEKRQARRKAALDQLMTEWQAQAS